MGYCSISPHLFIYIKAKAGEDAPFCHFRPLVAAVRWWHTCPTDDKGYDYPDRRMQTVLYGVPLAVLWPCVAWTDEPLLPQTLAWGLTATVGIAGAAYCLGAMRRVWLWMQPLGDDYYSNPDDLPLAYILHRVRGIKVIRQSPSIHTDRRGFAHTIRPPRPARPS